MSSRSADAAIGMMDTAYFVGRAQLLAFFNDLLQLNLSKIEETASGAVACQLTEYIFPGSIPMQRVNWEARSDYEFVSNYKLLQAAFTKNNVSRHVDVDKLIRAKYQDNLEFCQWLKAFFDMSGADGGDGYDPVAVRAKGKGGKKYNDKMAGDKSSGGARSRVTSAANRRVAATTTKTTQRVSARNTTSGGTTSGAGKITRSGATTTSSKAPLKQTSENKVDTASAKATADGQLLKRNADLEEKIRQLEEASVEVERERDFYFGKLRNIELMLQVKQGKEWEGCDLNDVVDRIFKIMYATADNDVDVDEDGEIVSALDQDQEVSGDFSAELSDALGSDEVVGEQAEEVAIH